MLIIRVGKEYVKLMRAAIVLTNKIDFEKSKVHSNIKNPLSEKRNVLKSAMYFSYIP